MQSMSQYAGDLTLLYTETKQKALSSIGKTADSPALPNLDRKLRIQKDRLITWGLEWTDQSDHDKGSAGDIDQSVARAGVTETVESVLHNIQEVLEQAETIKTTTSAWPTPEKPGSLSIDEAKYQDLLKDLESSVDVLYEISRSRRALATGSHPTFTSDQYAHEYAPGTIADSTHLGYGTGAQKDAPASKAGEAFAPHHYPSFASSQTTLINPSFARPNLSPYAGLPASLSPQALILPAEAPPPYESFGVPSATRMIGRLIKSRVPESVRGALRSASAEAHVLVEYANYDPLYHETGVPPPLLRLEGLSGALQQAHARQERSLILLGYFEDPHQPRIGLVYDFLGALHSGVAALDLELERLTPVSLLNLLQVANKGAKPADIANAMPFLEDRFRVALRVANNLKDLHTEGYAHGNLNSGSVIFFRQGKEPHLRTGELHRPALSAFDMFSKTRIERGSSASSINITKHPLDHDANLDNTKAIQYDLYGLALLLLEIGLWVPLHDLYKPKYSLKDFKLRIEKIWVPRLAPKCGSLYMRAVQACLRLSDDPELGKINTESIYEGIIRRLQRCCYLDEDEPVYPGNDSFPQQLQAAYWPTGSQDLGIRRYGPPSDMGSVRSFSSDGQLPSPALSARMPSSRLPNIAAALGPAQRRPVPPLGRSSLAHLDRSRSFSSIASTLAPSVHERQLSKQNTATSPFREYRQKVVLIQTCWRERCRRKAITQDGKNQSSQGDMPRLPHTHRRLLGTIESQSPRAEGLSRRTSEISRKCQVFPIKLPQPALDDWHSNLGLRISRIVERALKDSTESSSIDLVGFGQDPFTAKPTILVTCASTARVKAALKRKFEYDRSIFDLKVRKGRISLARGKGAVKERSVKRASSADSDDGESDDTSPLNPFFQQRPLCGASIGAYLPNHGHLNPVSYGGVVMVEKEGQAQAYGMSVHHMLDPPEDDDDDDAIPSEGSDNGVSRSSSRSDIDTSDVSDLSDFVESGDEESGYMSSEFESDISEDEQTMQHGRHPESVEQGDRPGMKAQGVRTVPVTQPAFRDAWEQDLHADDAPLDELDDDHLASYNFGKVYASSGLKRMTKNGMRHEIDWALIELEPPRVQPFNLIQGGRRYCSIESTYCPSLKLPICRQPKTYTAEEDLYPVDIVPLNQLASLSVHSFGRTSGLQSGTISAGMSFVKIRGRRNFSSSWSVIGGFGVGGDSGAWVIDNASGRVCGHVLAERDGMAYICSMQLLFEDMKTTLGATRVRLPGSLVDDEDAAMEFAAVLTEGLAGAVAKLDLKEKEARRSRYKPARGVEKRRGKVDCAEMKKGVQV